MYTALSIAKKASMIFPGIFILCSLKPYAQTNTPIWFKDYKIKLNSAVAVGDTMSYSKGSNEGYLFVFLDKKSKCYCEKYIDGILVEKGVFAISQNPSEVQVSARSSKGGKKPIRIEEWLLPVKDGEWHVYNKDGEIKVEKYKMGVLEN